MPNLPYVTVADTTVTLASRAPQLPHMDTASPNTAALYVTTIKWKGSPRCH